MASKQPAFQFYPGDWMKDMALRAVSPAARGLWIDMLCLMFDSSRRGYLQQANGTPYSQVQIARMTGCTPDEAAHLLQELEDSGVLSRTDHGVIYSRRLVRDERKRQLCSDAGKKGGGNPDLATYKGRNKGHPKGVPKRKPKASSSTSSSSSTSVSDASASHSRFVKPTVAEVAAYCQERGNSVDPEQFVDHYESNGWRVGGKGPMKDWKAAVRTWEKNHFKSPGRQPTGNHSGLKEFLARGT